MTSPGTTTTRSGSSRSPATPRDHAEATFGEDDAEYKLTYSVVGRPDIAATDLAGFALDQFEASTAPGLWPQIAKTDLIADIRATRADTLQVNQNSSQFCGPTSIVYELVSRQPRRYVDLCRQLYETGGFWSRTYRVDAPEGLRNGPVGQSMSPADWMLIATMRDNENAVFGVSPDADGALAGIQGMTTHWEMEGWTSEILLYDNVDNSTTFVWGEFDAIRHADSVYQGGGVAFIMIHADLLEVADSTIPPWPTHWVVYRGGLNIDDSAGRIQLSVYSWGQIYNVDVTLSRFEDCMFGTVTGY